MHAHEANPTEGLDAVSWRNCGRSLSGLPDPALGRRIPCGDSTVTGRDIEQIRQRQPMAADAPELLAARDSLKQFLGIAQLNT